MLKDHEQAFFRAASEAQKVLDYIRDAAIKQPVKLAA
jgi:hypothetical protein